MRLIFKLIWAQFRHHWFRTLLAASAVITSVAMVVVIIGSETATVIQADAAAPKMIGSFDLIIYAGNARDVEADQKRNGANPPLPPFDAQVLQWLRGNSDIKTVTEECEMVGELPKLPASALTQLPSLTPHLIKPQSPKSPQEALQNTVASLTPGFIPPEPMPIIGIASADPPRPLARGRWLNSGDTDAVVLDGDVARRIKYDVGQDLEVTTVTGRHTVKIVGVLDTRITLHGITGIYTGPSLFAELAAQPIKTNRVLVGLKDGASEQAFRNEFSQTLQMSRQSAQIQSATDLLNNLARSATPIASGAWAFPLLRDASVKLAIVAAMFIIFNTFSMGVQERTRQLAMLRAIGMTRRQIVATVLCEGMLVALAGWAIGMVIGWEILGRSGSIASPSGLPIRLQLDPIKLMLLGALASFGAVLIATLIPAILASRKRPLDALLGSGLPASQSAPWWLGLIGLILISLNPLAAYLSLDRNPMHPAVLVPLSYAAALIGFVLLIPSLLKIFEKLFVHVTAAILFLNPRLLQRHLSANLWRTVGCVSALMVGLGLYMLVQIWGHSMAVPFLITRCPDAVVIVSPNGVPPDRLPELDKLDGVTAALPLILEHPVLADLPAYVPVTGFDFFSKDMMLVGCDIPGLIDPHNGMFDGIFVHGNARDAYQALGHGDACLITDNLWRRVPEKYDLGKTITMTTDDIPHRTITYTIAGVVQMDGWHQFSQRTRMRRNAGRSGGIVMVPTATARAAYPKAMFSTLWFKLAADKDPSTLETPILKIVDANDKSPRTVPITTDSSSNVQSVGMENSPYCQIIDGRALAGAQRVMFQRVIDSIAYYPLWALVLASAAVINTIFASIRARSWEIGILRSIGQTRGQVIRQVLADGILIGLLAYVVSLLFALLATKAGIIAATRTMDVTAPYLIPWKTVLIGLAAVLFLCLGASVFPAISLARREPLQLLQEGRTMN